MAGFYNKNKGIETFSFYDVKLNIPDMIFVFDVFGNSFTPHETLHPFQDSLLYWCIDPQTDVRFEDTVRDYHSYRKKYVYEKKTKNIKSILKKTQECTYYFKDELKYIENF